MSGVVFSKVRKTFGDFTAVAELDLEIREGETVYGRCNQLLDSEGIVFADIVEILPRSNESERLVESVTPS